MSIPVPTFNVCGLRPRLDRFAHAMEATLRAHDDKPGWFGPSLERVPMWWLQAMQKEVKELREALESGEIAIAMTECCDVANFAMMCFDALAALTRDSERRDVVEPIG